jgi:ABC-type transport system involved in Fe-S cluster assembly fused permease/ATPase subunit
MKIYWAIFILLAIMNLSFFVNPATFKMRCKTPPTQNDSIFTIKRIDSLHNYYAIYCIQNDKWIKIISKKERCRNRKKIRVNSKYRLSLLSVFSSGFELNGKHYETPPHIDCIQFDADTAFCKERDSIGDLYVAKNLEGLCLMR